MDVDKFIEELLTEVSLDERIENGAFDPYNAAHLHVLFEHTKGPYGIPFASQFIHSIYETLHDRIKEGAIEEGNYPERQAYNADGKLVTFPDAEAKKAAIDRGSHFESNPKPNKEKDISKDDKKKNDDSDDENETEQGDDEVNKTFANYESPEQSLKSVEDDEDESSMAPSDKDSFVIRPREKDGEEDDSENKGEVHHIYDILTDLKNKQDQVTDPSAGNYEFGLDWDNLHPSILYALAQKWEFDKSGLWFDEFDHYRAATDRRGHLDPAKSKDKDEMLLWISDYLKRTDN